MLSPRSDKEREMARDRRMTESRILKAVGTLLSEKGFQGIGINAVAREAGVDKVLIYRYFGGMPQLLRAFAHDSGFWPAIPEILGGPLDDRAGLDLETLSVDVLKGYLQEIRRRPATQEILRWELIQRNELTDELADFRESQGIEILDWMLSATDPDPGMDLAAVAALLHSGLIYLILRSKTADFYQGVDLQSEDGWKRIEAAVETLVHAYFAYHRKTKIQE